MLVIFLACLACDIMLTAADDCPGTVTEPNFDVNKFSGLWYVLYLPPEMLTEFNHWKHIFEGEPEYKVYVEGIYLEDKQPKSFNGTWLPFKPGFYQVELPTFSQLNGPFTIVATDYTCFFIMRGCPKAGAVKDLVKIEFRDEHPTEKCVNDAKEAMKKSNLDFGALKRDNSF